MLCVYAPKKVLGPQEFLLQVVVSGLAWGPWAKVGSFAGTAPTQLQSLSVAPWSHYFYSVHFPGLVLYLGIPGTHVSGTNLSLEGRRWGSRVLLPLYKGI